MRTRSVARRMRTNVRTIEGRSTACAAHVCIRIQPSCAASACDHTRTRARFVLHTPCWRVCA
jgi:hypothetical protein